MREMFTSSSAQLTAFNEKVDRQAERPSRGRSSTKRGRAPCSANGDPNDPDDPEEDEESEEGDWDEEGEDEHEYDKYGNIIDINVSPSAATT